MTTASVQTNVIEINGGHAQSSNELHSILARHLGFPNFYGCNWDAFWDAITGLIELPIHLRFVGWSALTSRMPEDAKMLHRCMDDFLVGETRARHIIEYV